MRVGIIGVGRWGHCLARNFYQMGVLKALCDLSPISGYSDIPWSRDASTLLYNKDISQIVIATPPDTHYLLVKQALLAGKDVFVEKPFCFFHEQALELTRLAQERGRILMVGHLLHYHPCIALLKEMVHSGYLGEILSVDAVRATPQCSHTSLLWDLGPHDVSLLLALFNSPITAIFCEKEEKDYRVSLHFSKNLSFGLSPLKSGEFTRASLGFLGEVNGQRPFTRTKSTRDANKVPEFEGEKPKTQVKSFHAHLFFTISQNKKQMFRIVGSKMTAIFSSNETLTLTSGETFYAKKEPLRIECEHFLECCRTRRAPLTDGREATYVTEILQNAEENSRAHSQYKVRVSGT